MNNAKLIITGDDMALKHHGIILWTSFKTKEGETRHNNEKNNRKSTTTLEIQTDDMDE